MSKNYFNSTGTIGFTCDVCGRELQSCTWISGMRFCAKCYQETFGASKDWQLLDKDKTIAEQRKQIADLEAKLAEKDKEIETMKQILVDREETIVFADKTIKGFNLNQKQDKISFAIAELEKVKELVKENESWEIEGSDYSIVYADDVLDQIDNQIKQLKEMK